VSFKFGICKQLLNRTQEYCACYMGIASVLLIFVVFFAVYFVCLSSSYVLCCQYLSFRFSLTFIYYLRYVMIWYMQTIVKQNPGILRVLYIYIHIPYMRNMLHCYLDTAAGTSIRLHCNGLCQIRLR
jgi:hypothetical protein